MSIESSKKLSYVQQRLMISHLSKDRADALRRVQTMQAAATGFAAAYHKACALLQEMLLMKQEKDREAEENMSPVLYSESEVAFWSSVTDTVRKYEAECEMLAGTKLG